MRVKLPGSLPSLTERVSPNAISLILVQGSLWNLGSGSLWNLGSKDPLIKDARECHTLLGLTPKVFTAIVQLADAPFSVS